MDVSSLVYAGSCNDLKLGDEILISAVLYDPEGPDKGKEWIELYNPTSKTISLESYRIDHGDGIRPDEWSLIWHGTSSDFIYPYHHFLIADSDVIPIPDVYESLVMQNGPDGIRLVKDNLTIDKVGWGNHDYPEYYLGSPTPDARSIALRRHSESFFCYDLFFEKKRLVFSYNNTYNNSRDFDFCSGLPNSQFSSDTLPIIFYVDDISLKVSSFESSTNQVLDDKLRILPYPGKDQKVIFDLIINTSLECSSSINVTFSSPLLSHKFPSLGSFFDSKVVPKSLEDDSCIASLELDLPFSLEPGTYNITAKISSQYETLEQVLTFDYLSLLSFEIDSTVLDFGVATQFSDSFIFGDNDMLTPLSPTIRNTGNEPIDFLVSGFYPYLGDAKDSIDTTANHNLSFLSMSLDLDPDIDSDWVELSADPSRFEVGLLSGMTIPLSLRLSLPQNINKGDYSYGLVIMATNS